MPLVEYRAQYIPFCLAHLATLSGFQYNKTFFVIYIAVVESGDENDDDDEVDGSADDQERFGNICVLFLLLNVY